MCIRDSLGVNDHYADDGRVNVTSTLVVLNPSLMLAARDTAQDLVNTWEAFGAFCRTRVGVSPKVMLGKVPSIDPSGFVERTTVRVRRTLNESKLVRPAIAY